MRLVFQIILIVMLLGVAIYFLSNTNQRAQAYKKVAIIAFFIIGALTLLFPWVSDDIAKFLGIESGTALVLYVVIFAVIYLFISVSLERRRNQQKIATLVRKIAILEQQVKDLNIKIE